MGVPTVGVNAAGFALSLNYFETDPQVGMWLPQWPHRRALQTARSVEGGIQIFLRARERGISSFMVMADAAGDLAFGVGPPADLPADVIPVGNHVEVAPALETLITSLASRFRQHPGRALFIDYGPDDRSPDETLRSYKAGEQIHPLAEPGLSDLTADVDFPRLRRICESEGLAVHGPTQQRYFLIKLGAKERTEALIRANPQRADEIRRAVEKLVSPDQMGTRFKCIAMTPHGVEPPPGF